MANWNIGDKATWLHTPRGGYGYTEEVPVLIEKITPKRIRVKARRANGEFKSITVRPEHLRLPRDWWGKVFMGGKA